jgi:hypothetical protein
MANTANNQTPQATPNWHLYPEVLTNKGNFCDCSSSMTPKAILPSLVARSKIIIIQCYDESSSNSLNAAPINFDIPMQGSGPESIFPLVSLHQHSKDYLKHAWRHALPGSNDDSSVHFDQTDSDDPYFDDNDEPSSKSHHDFDDDDNALL